MFGMSFSRCRIEDKHLRTSHLFRKLFQEPLVGEWRTKTSTGEKSTVDTDHLVTTVVNWGSISLRNRENQSRIYLRVILQGERN